MRAYLAALAIRSHIKETISLGVDVGKGSGDMICLAKIAPSKKVSKLRSSCTYVRQEMDEKRLGYTGA